MSPQHLCAAKKPKGLCILTQLVKKCIALSKSFKSISGSWCPHFHSIVNRTCGALHMASREKKTTFSQKHSRLCNVTFGTLNC